MKIKKIVTSIKTLRELKGISRKEIALQLNIGVSGYSKIERGEIDLTLNKLFKISEIIGYSLIEIIEFEPKELLSKNNSISSRNKNTLPKKNAIVNYEYIEKYIALLENEIKSLKKIDSTQISN
jgi:transcriptional regulator with XRE-family HTH domain